MILLDTNVISALMQKEPPTEVIRWLDRQPHTSLWTTSVNVFEIHSGLQTMASGKRRTLLTSAFDILVTQMLDGRIAPFDTAAAHQAAILMATRQAIGRSTEMRDTMIAGIALATHATLATRNTKHFEDLAPRLIDPWIHVGKRV